MHIKQKVSELPQDPGVYFMKNLEGNIIYIGKAKNLKNRVSSYFVNTAKPQKVVQMLDNVFTFDYVICQTEQDALNLESNLIKKHKPFYNILLKAGGGHSYIKINTKLEFPKLETTRVVLNDGAKYFGPYFSGVSARDLIKIIGDTFMLRDCNLLITQDKTYKRECLNYFLGICSAPCTGRINREDYGQQVKKVIDFLQGNLQEAQTILTEKMMKNAQLENFERALELKNSLQLIENLKTRVITEIGKVVDIDVLGYATNGFNSSISVLVIRGGKLIGESNYMVIDGSLTDGETLSNFAEQYYKNSTLPAEIVAQSKIEEATTVWLTKTSKRKITFTRPQKGKKKQLLIMANKNAEDFLEKNIAKTRQKWLSTHGAMEQLKSDLSLASLPKRIECYDISNLHGTHIVASMVVFISGEPYRSHYRKFKINTVVSGEGNDYQSMREVLTRRLKNLNGDDESFKNVPNLIVVDGGKGQLGVAVSVLKQMNVNSDVLAIAEKNDEIFVPNKSQSFYFPRQHEGLKFLQRLRNEAHRFAITYHRNLKNIKEITSELVKINGIGKITAQKIIKHFKGISAVKAATVEQLLEVSGVGHLQAENIFNYFHNS